MTVDEMQVAVMFGIAIVVMITGLIMQSKQTNRTDLTVDQLIHANRIAGTIQLIGFIMLLFLIFKYIINAEH